MTAPGVPRVDPLTQLGVGVAVARRETRVRSLLREPMDATPPTSLLTTEVAAELLCVSVRTVKNLLSDGRIPYVKIGRATRIHPQDLDDYIARNRRKRRVGYRATAVR